MRTRSLPVHQPVVPARGVPGDDSADAQGPEQSPPSALLQFATFEILRANVLELYQSMAPRTCHCRRKASAVSYWSAGAKGDSY